MNTIQCFFISRYVLLVWAICQYLILEEGNVTKHWISSSSKHIKYFKEYWDLVYFSIICTCNCLLIHGWRKESLGSFRWVETNFLFSNSIQFPLFIDISPLDVWMMLEIVLHLRPGINASFVLHQWQGQVMLILLAELDQDLAQID